LVKIANPVATSIVLLAAIVGLADVLQQKPREVIFAPPSDVMVTVQLAEVDVKFDKTGVDITAKEAAATVVKVTCAPYPVPTLLVA